MQVLAELHRMCRVQLKKAKARTIWLARLYSRLFRLIFTQSKMQPDRQILTCLVGRVAICFHNVVSGLHRLIRRYRHRSQENA